MADHIVVRNVFHDKGCGGCYHYYNGKCGIWGETVGIRWTCHRYLSEAKGAEMAREVAKKIRGEAVCNG